jgi:hypothetical protein
MAYLTFGDLREYQRDDEKKIRELTQKVYQKLKTTRAIIKLELVKEFVEQNYDLLVTDIDTIDKNILLNNYMDFFKKSSVFESINNTIIETEFFLKELREVINTQK